MARKIHIKCGIGDLACGKLYGDFDRLMRKGTLGGAFLQRFDSPDSKLMTV